MQMNLLMKSVGLFVQDIDKGREFIFDSAHLMYCKCYKVNFRRGGSYIDSPDRI